MSEHQLGVSLDEDQVAEIRSFLESLTGTRIGSNRIDVRAPESVPSGLTPPADLEPVLTN